MHLEWYDYRMHLGIAKEIKKLGWKLESFRYSGFVNTPAFKNLKVDGCIGLSISQDTLNKLLGMNVPVVELGHCPSDREIVRIVPSNVRVAKMAAEHFRDSGYKNVVALNPNKLKMYNERVDNLKRFMEKYGGGVTVLNSSVVNSDMFDELAELAAKNGNALKKSSFAFFAYTDAIGANIVSSAQRQGLKVPENIAVLGVDNDNIFNESLQIPLSSVDTNPEEIGRKSLEILSRIIVENEYPENPIVHIPPSGVVCRNSTSNFNVEDELVARALNWISKNFHMPIQAVDIARELNVSQQGMQKAFIRSHVRTPGQEIRYQRVQEVAKLLRQSTVNLQVIASACGFLSADTMIVNFKKQYDMTPGEFRNKYYAE